MQGQIRIGRALGIFEEGEEQKANNMGKGSAARVGLGTERPLAALGFIITKLDNTLYVRIEETTLWIIQYLVLEIPDYEN